MTPTMWFGATIVAAYAWRAWTAPTEDPVVNLGIAFIATALVWGVVLGALAIAASMGGPDDPEGSEGL